jgi:hypothetical protein
VTTPWEPGTSVQPDDQPAVRGQWDPGADPVLPAAYSAPPQPWNPPAAAHPPPSSPAYAAGPGQGASGAWNSQPTADSPPVIQPVMAQPHPPLADPNGNGYGYSSPRVGWEQTPAGRPAPPPPPLPPPPAPAQALNVNGNGYGTSGGTEAGRHRRERPAVPDPWASGAGPDTTQLPAVTPPPVPPGEQWVYVDPSAFSDPYTEAPVYTSGAQPVPSHGPLEPQYSGATAGAATAVLAGPGAELAGAHPGTGHLQPPPDRASGPPPPGDPLLSSSYQPEKGELDIKERRSWRTWQLVTLALVAAVLGMGLAALAGPNSTSTASSSRGGYKLPPPSGSTATTGVGSTPAKAGAGAGAGSTTTTAAGGSTSTTAAGGSTSATTAAGSTATTVAGAAGSTGTTTPAVVGPATVLVPEVQQTGDWTSPSFTIAGGTWNIGWAFQCTPAPSATPSFEIFVVDTGAAAGSTPAVTSSAASGNSVTPLTTTGSQQVMVQTTAACRWAVKVTGSGS